MNQEERKAEKIDAKCGKGSRTISGFAFTLPQ
jgi:hypothetical protein